MGIRRSARALLKDAIDAAAGNAADMDERVHNVRTSLKKVRSLLRLVRDTLPRAREEEARLRKLGRKLAPVRDAKVIHDHVPWLERPAVDGEALLGSLRAPLVAARRRAKKWRPEPRGWRGIEKGVADGYRQVKRAAKRAFAGGADDAYHSLRKAVKRHLHQMAFLDNPRAAALDHLGDLLGEDHDLAIVDEALRDAVDRGEATPEQIEPLLVENGERRGALRAEVFTQIGALFGDRARDFGTLCAPSTPAQGGKQSDLAAMPLGTPVASNPGRARARRLPVAPVRRLLPGLPRRTLARRGWHGVRRHGRHAAQPRP